MPSDCLDGRGRPCPLWGGEDRFNAAKNVNETGAVFCRKCFDKASTIKPGDGIATMAWLHGNTNGEAAWIADQLGLSGNAKATDPIDIVTAVCQDNRMPIDAFMSFGVKEATRGRGRSPVARVDVYNEAGSVHSYFDL